VSVPSSTISLLLIAITTLAACVTLGGGLYEYLVVTLVVAWGDADVRIALLVALVGHAALRVWSLVDFVPKAVAFDKADPASVDEAAAVRWTRRSLFRLPLDLITCGAMLAALAGYS
jgi:hypothetical protein